MKKKRTGYEKYGRRNRAIDALDREERDEPVEQKKVESESQKNVAAQTTKQSLAEAARKPVRRLRTGR